MPVKVTGYEPALTLTLTLILKLALSPDVVTAAVGSFRPFTVVTGGVIVTLPVNPSTRVMTACAVILVPGFVETVGWPNATVKSGSGGGAGVPGRYRASAKSGPVVGSVAVPT